MVRRADMTIVDAAADMQTYPHAECTDIEPSFHDLVGLSVARGYSNAVQQRFGRQRGCSHLEFLARAIGPVVDPGPHLVGRLGGREGERGAPHARRRVRLLDQHLPHLDRGRRRARRRSPPDGARGYSGIQRPRAVEVRRRMGDMRADDGVSPDDEAGVSG